MYGPAGYCVLKIGLPRLRFSRKLLIITLGITVLLGGTAAAALYFKSKELGLERVESIVGGECTDVLTMVQKTPSNRLWLRRFIRMENANGPDRVRTALRVAGLLAKKNAVDLIHVSVLDSHGPTLRSQMRARSIGAEVLIAMKPDMLPEMKSPAMASYYEGPVNDQGRYYGDKVVVDIEEIGHIMTAMRSVEEKSDCVSPEKAEDAEAKPNDHGKKEEKADHGKKPAEDHGAKPEETEGDKSAESHGEEPAKDGAEDRSKAEAPAKEQSFVDSMLSMVGLGGGETPAAEPATDNSHAVAEEPADAANEDHGKKPETNGHEPAAEDKAANKPAGDDEAKTGDHEAKPAAENAEQAAEDASPAKAEHDNAASTEEQGKKPATDTEAESHEEKPAAKAEDHSAAKSDVKATEGHDTEAKTETNAAEGDKVEAHADPAPAEEEPAPPAEADDHAEPAKKKSDEHALADMPVGD